MRALGTTSPEVVTVTIEVNRDRTQIREFRIMPIEPLGLIVCLLISFVAAMIHGVIGLGFNFICAPVLLLLYPQLVPAPIIINSIIIVSLVAWVNREDVEFRTQGWLVGACTLGALFAAFAITRVSEATYTSLFGALLLVAVACSLLGWHPRLTVRNALVAGGLSGFMGTITSVGGPPVALLFQHLPGPALRGTLSAYFLLTSPIILIALYAADRLGWDEVKLSVVLLPGMLLGFLCSKFLAAHLGQQAIRATVLTICAGGGITLLVRSL